MDKKAMGKNQSKKSSDKAVDKNRTKSF